MPLVVANENMQQYTKRLRGRDDQLHGRAVSRFGPAFNNRGDRRREHIYYFAGDTMFGRAMTRLLSQEGAADRIAEEILARTRSRPLVVNLEGVILPNVPEALEHMTLGMPEELAIPWLKRLNVAGVSLANNHAFDLGESGYAETLSALKQAGIPAFGQGETLELPGLDVVGMTDIGTNGTDGRRPDHAGPASIGWRKATRRGRWWPSSIGAAEYAAEPGAREKMLADEMRLRSVSAIVGAHPHVASEGLTALGGGDTLLAYSLGNFLFDQTAEKSSGAILELRVFEQGTFFARLLPVPNFFDMGRE